MKNKYLQKTEKFKLKQKTKELFKKQIELFYITERNDKTNTLINNDVVLNSNTLIHGSRATLETLEIISNEGLIASEFYSELNINKKKPYVVELWDVKETIKLKDWVNKFAGVTIDFKNREGNVYKSVISPFDEIKINIQKEKEFRDYIIYQNQEQRFIPNDVVDNEANVAFIVEFDNIELIENDIFNEKFDIKIIKDMLPKWFFKKYMQTRSFDNYETGREKAIIFGIPKTLIKGIMVSRNFEHNQETLERIKELFPECYICNIDGQII